jgi:flagellar biosynthetic protein FliQ
MTLTFVPKILAILLGLLVFGSWMLELLTRFTINTIEQIPLYIK